MVLLVPFHKFLKSSRRVT